MGAVVWINASGALGEAREWMGDLALEGVCEMNLRKKGGMLYAKMVKGQVGLRGSRKRTRRLAG